MFFLLMVYFTASMLLVCFTLQVRGLAASLEASLNAREGIKKPTGSVDLHDTMKSTEGAAFKPSMVGKSFS